MILSTVEDVIAWRHVAQIAGWMRVTGWAWREASRDQELDDATAEAMRAGYGGA